MESKQGRPIIAFASPADWEQWLTTNHETAPGLWVKIAKKGAGIDSVTYAEVLDGALCYGWIDGQKASFDEQFWLQRFTPRGRHSKWSQINRDKVAELMRQDRMKPAGLAQVERAQQDGRWDAAYPPQSRITVPDDLQVALDDNPAARANFDQLDRLNRYAILYRLHDTRNPETRARRIDHFVAMLAENQKPYP